MDPAGEYFRRIEEAARAKIGHPWTPESYGGPPKLDAIAAGREALGQGEAVLQITAPVACSQMARAPVVTVNLHEERLYPPGTYLIPAAWRPSDELVKARGLKIERPAWLDEARCPFCGTPRGQPHDLLIHYPEPPSAPEPDSVGDGSARRREELEALALRRSQAGWRLP